MTIDTTNMCSHLQRKLFDEDGIYHQQTATLMGGEWYDGLAVQVVAVEERLDHLWIAVPPLSFPDKRGSGVSKGAIS